MRDLLGGLEVAGLPAHPLVVHAVVAGVPALAVLAVLMLARRRWRDLLGGPTAALAVLLALATALAAVTGEGLLAGTTTSAALGRHAEFGALAPWFVAAAALAGLAQARWRHGALGLATAAAFVVTTVAASLWVVLTGHAGAVAIWG